MSVNTLCRHGRYRDECRLNPVDPPFIPDDCLTPRGRRLIETARQLCRCEETGSESLPDGIALHFPPDLPDYTDADGVTLDPVSRAAVLLAFAFPGLCVRSEPGEYRHTLFIRG